MRKWFKSFILIILVCTSIFLTVYYCNNQAKAIPFASRCEFRQIDTTDFTYTKEIGTKKSIILDHETALWMATAFYEDLCFRNDEYKDFNPKVSMVVEHNSKENYWYIRNQKPQNQKYYFLIIDDTTAEIKALWTEQTGGY